MTALPATSSRPPWQPLTLGGVAGFAHAPLGRLIAVALTVALVAAASVAFFLLRAWGPAITQAISQLPDRGEIRNGKLDWHGPSRERLANGAFLSIIVNLDGGSGPGEAADVQCEFHRTSLRLRSFLGYLDVPYPGGWRIALNRTELQPWWGAWFPAIIAGAMLATMAWLGAVWSALAALYALPVSVLAFYADRAAGFFESWKLSVAALMPGALVMSLGIAAYAFYQIHLIQFLIVWLAHFAVAWIYVLGAPWRLPRLGAPSGRANQKNPFRKPGVR